MYPVYANIKYMSHGDSLIPGYSTCDPASHKRSEKVVEDGSNPWVPLTLARDGLACLWLGPTAAVANI